MLQDLSFDEEEEEPLFEMPVEEEELSYTTNSVFKIKTNSARGSINSALTKSRTDSRRSYRPNHAE